MKRKEKWKKAVQKKERKARYYYSESQYYWKVLKRKEKPVLFCDDVIKYNCN